MQTSRVNNSRILRIKNAKFSEYCFYMNTNIQGDFQICISLPLKVINLFLFDELLTVKTEPQQTFCRKDKTLARKFYENITTRWRNYLVRTDPSRNKNSISEQSFLVLPNFALFLYFIPNMLYKIVDTYSAKKICKWLTLLSCSFYFVGLFMFLFVLHTLSTNKFE